MIFSVLPFLLYGVVVLLFVAMYTIIWSLSAALFFSYFVGIFYALYNEDNRKRIKYQLLLFGVSIIAFMPISILIIHYNIEGNASYGTRILGIKMGEPELFYPILAFPFILLLGELIIAAIQKKKRRQSGTG